MACIPAALYARPCEVALLSSDVSEELLTPLAEGIAIAILFRCVDPDISAGCTADPLTISIANPGSPRLGSIRLQ